MRYLVAILFLLPVLLRAGTTYSVTNSTTCDVSVIYDDAGNSVFSSTLSPGQFTTLVLGDGRYLYSWDDCNGEWSMNINADLGTTNAWVVLQDGGVSAWGYSSPPSINYYACAYLGFFTAVFCGIGTSWARKIYWFKPAGWKSTQAQEGPL